jgi:lauroyl/myristoyl acyltransferase
VLERVDELMRSGDRKRDVLANTSLFTRLIEEKVREFPSQWVWIHDRWGKYRRRHFAPNPDNPGPL